MDPVPRARLCQLEPPCHSPEDVGAICRKSPRRSRSSSELATSIPAAASASLPSRWASRASGPKRPSGPASASTALARFMRSLRYFQRMMSGRATDWKVVVAMASAIARHRGRPARRESAQVEQARDRGRVDLHDAGTELGGRAHDAHPVGVREVAQHAALVLHAVLHADHRRGRRRHRASCASAWLGVLPLHGQQHDRVAVGVTFPCRTCRIVHDPDGQRDRAVGCLEYEAGPQGAAVVTACNQGDVEASLEEPAPDRAADGTRTQHDETHAMHSATAACQALTVASLNPMERATALGGSVAAAPLRLVGGLAAPARGDMARNLRRAIGITGQPAPVAFDPDEAYLPPGGVARRVHADLPVMLIGGVSALLLQTLHPLAMAGVAEHSSYQEDPLGPVAPDRVLRRPRRPSARWPRRRRPSPRSGACTAASRASLPTGGPTRPTTPSSSRSFTSPRSPAS